MDIIGGGSIKILRILKDNFVAERPSITEKDEPLFITCIFLGF